MDDSQPSIKDNQIVPIAWQKMFGGNPSNQ
jgi:hypothetical protein